MEAPKCGTQTAGPQFLKARLHVPRPACHSLHALPDKHGLGPASYASLHSALTAPKYTGGTCAP